MTESRNARTARMYWESCWNERRLDLLPQVFHSTYTHGRTAFSPPEHAGIIKETVAAFPDLRVEVDELEDLGDVVITRSRFLGTHGGDFCGLTATDRPVEGPSLDVFFFSDGLVARLWHLFDHLPLVRDIGAEVRLGDQVADFD